MFDELLALSRFAELRLAQEQSMRLAQMLSELNEPAPSAPASRPLGLSLSGELALGH